MLQKVICYPQVYPTQEGTLVEINAMENEQLPSGIYYARGHKKDKCPRKLAVTLRYILFKRERKD